MQMSLSCHAYLSIQMLDLILTCCTLEEDWKFKPSFDFWNRAKDFWSLIWQSLVFENTCMDIAMLSLVGFSVRHKCLDLILFYLAAWGWFQGLQNMTNAEILSNQKIGNVNPAFTCSPLPSRLPVQFQPSDVRACNCGPKRVGRGGSLRAKKSVAACGIIGAWSPFD